jgi:MinD superfamily P-loop ATPase
MIIAPYRDKLSQIVILNPKGGCGKTTLATNLAIAAESIASPTAS